MTAADRNSSAALGALILVMFLNLMGVGLIIPLLPFYGRAFHAAPWQITLVFSGFALGSFFGEPYWGRLSDRIGRKPVLMMTVGSSCLCFAAMAFASNVWLAIFFRFLGGLAGGNGSVVQGYIADVTPPDKRAHALSLLAASFNVGFIVGPAIGGLMARPELGAVGFRPPLLAGASLAAIAVAGIGLFLKESRVRSTAPVSRQPNRWAMLGEAMRHPILRRLMVVSLVSGLAFNGVESTFALWTQARFDWGPKQVGLAFGAVGIVSAITQGLFLGRLSRRYGEATMMTAGMVLAFFCYLLQPFTTSGAMVIALLALNAIGVSVIFPNGSALVSRTADPDHQGQTLGLNNAANSSARVLGPLIAGTVFASISVNAPFWFAVLCVGPAIIMTRSISRTVKLQA